MLVKDSSSAKDFSGGLVSRATLIALAGFLCHFFIMTAYYVLKPMRSSVFLSTWGKEYFAAFLIANAITSFIASVVFGKLADSTSKKFFITGIQGFFIASIVCFWLYFSFVPINDGVAVFSLGMSACFILFVNCFVLFTVTPFWSLINDLFKAEQGKKLFGLIGSGGTLGALCGSQVARKLAKPLGTMNLLPLSAGMLALTIPLFLVLIRFGGLKPKTPGSRNGKRKELKGPLEGLRIVFKRPYVAMIATIVLLSTFCMAVIDYQLHFVVGNELSELDQQTKFFGSAHTWIQLISIPVHLLVTPALLSFFGAGAALALLPLGLLGSSVLILTKANIAVLFYVFVLCFALHYSVNQVSKELLYVPCDESVKYKAKAFIDIFGYRLGPVLCASIQLLGSYLLFAFTSYSFVVIGTSLAWLPLVGIVQRRFQQNSQTEK